METFVVKSGDEKYMVEGDGWEVGQGLRIRAGEKTIAWFVVWDYWYTLAGKVERAGQNDKD